MHYAQFPETVHKNIAEWVTTIIDDANHDLNKNALMTQMMIQQREFSAAQC